MTKIQDSKTMAALFVAACLCSCENLNEQDIRLVELGAAHNEFTIEKDKTDVEVEVFSNGPFHIEYVEDNHEWITSETGTLSGDRKIVFRCERNDEFKRSVKVILVSEVDERKDTIHIKQKGVLEAVLNMKNTSVIANGKGGGSLVPITTNVPFEYMTVAMSYETTPEQPWISSVTVEPDPQGSSEGTLNIQTLANPETSSPRAATIDLSFVDGWGDRVSIQVNLIQKTAGETLGEDIDIKTFRESFCEQGKVAEFVIIEGVVISNTPGGNAGENEQVTNSSIDYTGSQKTVYIQSTDGKYGLCLMCDTPEDNIFNQWDKVKILMRGTGVVRQEEPVRYSVSGIKKSMVVSQEKGSRSDYPEKVRHMNELTDDDVYTYVTLSDVEIPVRKGSLAPMNEGYTPCSDSHRISKFPRLIRDINGDAMYFYTNTVCVYRSDGSCLPYGSGRISGVLVHERYARYEWKDGADPLDIADDVTLGNIGRYQLRHQTKDDVWGQMNASVEDSFSAILAEYRFWNPDVDNCRLLPTYGENGWFDHTYQSKYTGSASKEYLTGTYQQHMKSVGSYSYLGPVGNKATCMFGYNVGNKNGIGCVLDPKKEHYNPLMEDLISPNPDGTIEWCGQYAPNPYAGHGPSGWKENLPSSCTSINYASTSLRGKAYVHANCYATFASSYWWDYDTNRTYGWLINFSTKGITTTRLSLQIAAMNGQQTWFTPRYWKAEWSFTDSQAPEDAAEWHLIKEYTVPDVSVNSNPLYSSIVAYKQMNFELPLELLGHENVYIRLSPTSDICSDGSDYANARMSGNPTASAHDSCLEYIAIRYNK